MKHFRGVMGNFGDGLGQCGGAVGQWGPRHRVAVQGAVGLGWVEAPWDRLGALGLSGAAEGG